MLEQQTSQYDTGFYSYRRLLYYLRHYWGWFLLGIVGTILLASTEAIN
jgi:uncharacterized protein involved in exopolysaccharide biosynthesis